MLVPLGTADLRVAGSVAADLRRLRTTNRYIPLHTSPTHIDPSSSLSSVTPNVSSKCDVVRGSAYLLLSNNTSNSSATDDNNIDVSESTSSSNIETPQTEFFSYVERHDAVIRSVLNSRAAMLRSEATNHSIVAARAAALRFPAFDDPSLRPGGKAEHAPETLAAEILHGFILKGIQWLVDLGAAACVYQDIIPNDANKIDANGMLINNIGNNNNNDNNNDDNDDDEDSEIDFDGDELGDSAQATFTALLLQNDMSSDINGNSNSRTRPNEEKPLCIRLRLFFLPEDTNRKFFEEEFSNLGKANRQLLMAAIFSLIDTSNATWTLRDLKVPLEERFSLQRPLMTPEIFEDIYSIYTTMASPDVDNSVVYANGTRESKLLMNSIIRKQGPLRNMRTVLYTYQRKALWKILQRELFPQSDLAIDLIPLKRPSEIPVELAFDPEDTQSIINPSLLLTSFLEDSTSSSLIHEHAYEDVNKDKNNESGNATQAAYFSTSTKQIIKDPIYYAESSGGIICEEMGTGKTCICISLILLTSHQISKPPVDCAGYKVRSELLPEMTLYKMYRGDFDELVVEEPSGAQSLMEMCAKSILLERRPYKHWQHVLSRPVTKLLRNNPSYYIKKPCRTVRDSVDPTRSICGTRIYLSSVTLVVVPDFLIDQWQMEIYKHVKDNVLKVLILGNDSKQDPIPDVMELLTFDAVLITTSRFSREYSKCNFVIDKRDCSCDCPFVPNAFNVRDCDCSGRYSKGKAPSPLQLIRWLRLIVDEGHNMGNRAESSSQVAMASLLECDRRWICSGTPMPSMSNKKIASADEHHNVAKLGSLLMNFLKVEPFSSNNGMYRNIILKPFLDREPFGQQRLRTLMERVQVRNRATVVAKDAELPPLHERVVPIAMTRFQRLSQNVVRSLISANAVLSEREHQDYYLHPSQQQYLIEVVTNLQLSTTWWAGPAVIEHALSTYYNVKVALQKVESGKKVYPQSDLKLLYDIIEHLKEALNDPIWRKLNVLGDLAMEITNPSRYLEFQGVAAYEYQSRGLNLYSGFVPLETLDEFDWCHKEFPPPTPTITPEIKDESTASLNENGTKTKMKSTGKKKKISVAEANEQKFNEIKAIEARSVLPALNAYDLNLMEMVDVPSTMVTCETALFHRDDVNEFLKHKYGNDWKSFLSKTKTNVSLQTETFSVEYDISSESNKENIHSNVETERKNKRKRVAFDDQPMVKEGIDNTTVPLSPPSSINVDDSEKHSTSNEDVKESTKTIIQPHAILSLNTLADSAGMDVQTLLTPMHETNSLIKGTASAKFSYLIDQIQKFHGNEKMLIYAQHNNDLFHLQEICQLLGVKFLMFHRQMKVRERSRNITTFNTSPNIWVMIMDARVGSWGIDLSSVTRVYFLTPIWRADMEQQAVKRAHRIGSTKPVHIETLVARETFEEALVARRSELFAVHQQQQQQQEQQEPVEETSKRSSVKTIRNAGRNSNRTRRANNFTEDGKMRQILTSGRFVSREGCGDTFATVQSITNLLPVGITNLLVHDSSPSEAVTRI